MAGLCNTLRKILPENFKSELKTIFKLSWPLIICNIGEFALPMIALQFAGQDGETSLAAVGLGTSFGNVFGYALIIGLDSATATLCSQAYGAKNYRRFGIIIQRSLIIQLMVGFTALAFSINSENILLLLQQDKDVSRLAETFILYRMPSLIVSVKKFAWFGSRLFQAVYRTLMSYLTSQHIVLPLVAISIINVIICVISNFVLVSVLKLGVIGCSIALNICFFTLCLSTVAYIKIKKVYKAWPGWSWECLLQWRQFFSLALPGALMIIFDWTTAEVGVVLLGLVGKKELGAQTVLLTIIGLLFMVPIGISVAATISVGKFMGSGEPRKAVNSTKSALVISWSIAICSASLLTATKDYVGYAFTNSKDVVAIITSGIPYIAAFHLLDGTQGICVGVFRGLGLQKLGAIVNLIGFDVIGLPLGTVFVFVLSWGVMGFWAGMVIGMFCQATALVLILSFVSWEKLSIKARRRAGVNVSPLNNGELEMNGCMEAEEGQPNEQTEMVTTEASEPVQEDNMHVDDVHGEDDPSEGLTTPKFAGRDGETPLAAVGLGITFCNVFGFAIIIGLDSATSTLCSQAYGAKNYRRFGIIIQRALLVQLVVGFSALAEKFILFRMPSLIFQAVYRTIRSYLISQHIVLPLVAVSIINVIICVISNFVLVSVLKLGVIGCSITLNLCFLMLCLTTLAYIKIKKVYKAWPGWSWECLLQWRQFFSLALPGSLMIIFDWTTAEIGVILLGLVGKKELGAQTVLLNILSLLYMIPSGISLAAGVSVGRLMGSGEPRKAVNTTKSAFCISWLIAICSASLLTATKDYVGYAFTNSKDVMAIITNGIPYMAAFHFLDGTQGVSAGVFRGLGLQKYGAIVNLIGFDVIGLPLGTVFVFVISWGVMGFWAGMVIGMFCQVSGLVLILIFINWEKLSKKARTRAGVNVFPLNNGELEMNDCMEAEEGQPNEQTEMVTTEASEPVPEDNMHVDDVHGEDDPDEGLATPKEKERRTEEKKWEFFSRADNSQGNKANSQEIPMVF
eukprot:gene21187-23264_t